MKGAQCFSVVVMLAGLVGCGGDEAVSDLDAYMSEVRLRPPGEIEPAPTFQPSPAFIYRAASLRSPFQPPDKVDPLGHSPGVGNVRPNPNRARQFLEGFDIEQFAMVGTISNASGSFVLLRGAGGVHRLKVGDYLGRNDGRIVIIGDAQVEVVEVVPDGAGAWLERSRIIPLKEHS